MKYSLIIRLLRIVDYQIFSSQSETCNGWCKAFAEKHVLPGCSTHGDILCKIWYHNLKFVHRDWEFNDYHAARYARQIANRSLAAAMKKIRKEYVAVPTFHSCWISHSLKLLRIRKIIFKYYMVKIRWRTLLALYSKFRCSPIYL